MTRPTILAALLMLAACSSGGSDDDAADNAAAPVALVTLGRVEQGAVSDNVTLYGVAEGGSTGALVLAAPAEAIVARIVAPVGTRVARGAIVVQLSPAPNTRVDLAKASADKRAADAAYARAKRLRADGLVSDAEVETARAAAQGADAAYATLSGQAGRMTLRAPADGFVQSIAATQGDLVQAGAAVATIARPGDLRAHFGADPAVARALHPGTAIKIEATVGRAAFAVPVQSVDPVVDPQTRLASIFARLPSGAGLALGETLTGTVPISTSNDALTIPYAALLDDGGQPYLFVVSGGLAHRHDVEIGATSGDRIAVIKGVLAGELVITDGGTAVEDGMKVRTK
ncbi:efflux RND transporter periplasmic adaptor subunit [Sphingomonas koreensis]|nr:efflux RND transporter periplasmic adaptor subunit [Sphingomonas koreensis]